MRLKFSILLIFYILVNSVYAVEIFRDNYDSHNDWSVPYVSLSKTWPTAVASDFPSANPTTGPRMIGYAGQLSVITGQTNPRIEITSSAGRGGSGKGIRMRCEAKYGANNEHSVWYSDTQTYYTLTSTPGDYGYDDIWIQFYRRYSTDFYSRAGSIKYMHVSHFRGVSLNDWHYDDESDVDHAPFIVLDTVTHDDDPYCCTGNYSYDDLTQDFDPWIVTMFREDPFANRTDYGPLSILEGLFDHESTGSVYVDQNITGSWRDNGNYGDGQWHYHEIHLKMNSAPGVADGEYGYWIDGVVQTRVNDVPWIATGGTMVGWNMVSPGGNQDFHTLVEGGETFYYDMDDFVVSTTRLSDETPTAPLSGNFIYTGSMSGGSYR